MHAAPGARSWLRQAGPIRAKVTVTKEPQVAKTDTAERRLTAVPQASQLSEGELGAWLRTHGLHRAQLDEWRAAMLAGLAGRGASGVSTGGHGRRVKELERELRRKDRALAEAAALLMLKLKFLNQNRRSSRSCCGIGKSDPKCRHVNR
jgi:hypothetical protein